MNKLSIGLALMLALSWGMLFMLFLDNRALAGLAEARAEKEWVRPESMSKLTDACARLSYVNKVDQALLNKARNFLDELEQIQDYNQQASPGGEEGVTGWREARRQRWHDKVRGVSRYADQGSDVGRGGPR